MILGVRLLDTLVRGKLKTTLRPMALGAVTLLIRLDMKATRTGLAPLQAARAGEILILRGLRLGCMEEDSVFADLRRFESMTDEEFEKYRGEWVAVAGGEIVAHGKDPLRVVRQGAAAARACPT